LPSMPTSKPTLPGYEWPTMTIPGLGADSRLTVTNDLVS